MTYSPRKTHSMDLRKSSNDLLTKEYPFNGISLEISYRCTQLDEKAFYSKYDYKEKDGSTDEYLFM
jgi:hypothetical protein